ncbi:DUF3299 domain-containing protein [Ideonella livida]|uniref:DUF3299 domain-containing protein n=1 Tax=Ideonella livida TaxID=2707176 RepID=A0A7C9PI84_9BURK|nr:DUF3299 domain-containing protein [Ideonella livida]NDY91750.1 DUF3299 domain-containing protein [Ideonella livida]
MTPASDLPSRLRRRGLLQTLAALALGHAATWPVRAAPREIKWLELVPAGWDPFGPLRQQLQGRDAASLSDGDPQVLELMRQVRQLWDAAPTVPAMDGVTGRIPGYIVPLDDASQGLREFLLVPYFGACIHQPPPPANQILRVVVSGAPLKGYRTMDTVWLTGTLRIERQDTAQGASGYRLELQRIDRYTASTRER